MGATRIPLWGRAAPALLSILVGIPAFALSFTIPTSVVYSTEECCPRRVVERIVEKDTQATVLFWALIVVSVLTLVAAGLFLVARVRAGSVVAAVAAPASFLTPVFLIGPVLLIAAVILAQAALRRSAQATSPLAPGVEG